MNAAGAVLVCCILSTYIATGDSFEPGSSYEHETTTTTGADFGIRELKFKARVLKQVQKMIDVMPEDKANMWIQKFERVMKRGSNGRSRPAFDEFFKALGKATYIPESISLPFKRLIVEHYHQTMWDFHNAVFFNFENALSAADLAYIYTCFRYAGDEHFTMVKGKGRLSYFSYSHRVKNDEVNSSRFAIGRAGNPEPVLRAVPAVMNQYNIHLGNPSGDMESCLLNTDTQISKTRWCQNLVFGGIGWDVHASHVKMYARIRDMNELPEQYHNDISGEALKAQEAVSGILSWTYHMSNGSLHESKVYSLESTEIKVGSRMVALNVTRLYADKRGEIDQYDIPSIENFDHERLMDYWKEQVNQVGRAIIEEYEDRGEYLDTIVVSSQNKFTLYFP